MWCFQGARSVWLGKAGKRLTRNQSLLQICRRASSVIPWSYFRSKWCDESMELGVWNRASPIHCGRSLFQWNTGNLRIRSPPRNRIERLALIELFWELGRRCIRRDQRKSSYRKEKNLDWEDVPSRAFEENRFTKGLRICRSSQRAPQPGMASTSRVIYYDYQTTPPQACTMRMGKRISMARLIT